MKPVVCVCVDWIIQDCIHHVYNSIKEHCRDFEFYILCDPSVKTELIEKFNGPVNVIPEVEVSRINIDLLDCPNPMRSKGAYLRFIAPYFIDAPRLIYTDVDVLFRNDITELWEMDLGRNMIGLCRDPFRATPEKLKEEQCNDRNNTYAMPDPVYASGLAVINVKQWKGRNMLNEATRIYQASPMLDMPLMNIICKDRIKDISDDWCVPINFMSAAKLIGTERIYNKISCYHWNGKKPWNGKSQGIDLYEKYAKSDF